MVAVIKAASIRWYARSGKLESESDVSRPVQFAGCMAMHMVCQFQTKNIFANDVVDKRISNIFDFIGARRRAGSPDTKTQIVLCYIGHQ
jgi:hypothetical protein